jgi:hypothetical protein
MTTQFAKVVEELTSKGSTFIAVDEQELTNENMVILYHTWGNNDVLRDNVREVNRIALDGETYPAKCINVLHTDVHFSSRIPVYSTKGILGNPKVPVEKGIKNVRKFVTGECESTPEPTETVPYKLLMEELVSAGASAIGIERSIFRCSEGNRFLLQISLEPGIGVPIIHQYSGVEVEGETYAIDAICNAVDGPSTLGKVTVYASDDIHGMEPVSIEMGWENLRRFLRRTSRSGKEVSEMSKVVSVEGETVTLAPLCQADSCDSVADHAIPSQDGHPNSEWKLCKNHFDDVDGRDPYQIKGKDWTVKKLYYRCCNCSMIISHNLELEEHSCPDLFL